MDTEDEILNVMAVGHDLIEDTKTTFQELRDMGFPDEVVGGIQCLTRMPGDTDAEYEARVMSNVRAMKVKRQDLRHNSDIRRLKYKVVTDKDISRTVKYYNFFLKIEAALRDIGELEK